MPPYKSEAGDDELVRQARADRDAFAALYERHFDMVYAYIRCRVNDRASADDLVATVFTTALVNLDAYRPELGSFGAWVVGIARNRLRDHRRHQSRWRWSPLERIREHPVGDRGADDFLEQDERRDRVLAAIGRLPDRERDVVGLKFGAGLSNVDIARLIGLSENHVAVIAYRALHRLRRQLADKEDGHV